MITNNVKQLSIKKKVNQSDLAAELNISRQTIYKYYHNKIRQFDEVTLEAFCKYFGVTLDKLLNIVPGERK